MGSISSAERNHGRQYPLCVTQSFAYTDLTAGSAVGAIKVPYGARVIGGFVKIDTAFDSTSTDTLKVGDGGDDDRYTASAINIHATGCTALTITGYKYTATDYIDLLWTSGGGTPSAGAGSITLMYIIDGRANEMDPDYD